MDKKVLVAYATKYGATAELAERIGQGLRAAGLDVDVTPVASVKDLTPYGAVVVGSSAYVGQWRKEAVRFVNSHVAELSARPVWVFSTGPTGPGDPAAQLEGWRIPKSIQPAVDQIKPRDIAVFHGVIFPEKLTGMHKWMIRMVKAPLEDNRDWDLVAAWSKAIAAALLG